jgi:hypothetical protein
MIQTKWGLVVFSMWKSAFRKITKIATAKKVKLKAFPSEIYYAFGGVIDQMFKKLNSYE